MKRFNIFLLFILISFSALLQSMHMATNIAVTIPMQCYDYLKSCDTVKALLVATVGILVFDRFCPLFRSKPTAFLPHPTYTQTEIEERIKKSVTEGINKFSETVFSTQINEINKKINETQKLSPQKEGEKEKEINVIPKIKVKKYRLNHEIAQICDVFVSIAEKPFVPLRDGSTDTYNVAFNEQLIGAFNGLIRKIESTLLARIQRKFEKLIKKNKIHNKITTTRSPSEDEHDSFFGNLNENPFKDSDLIDSDVISTQRKKEEPDHRTPGTPRGDGDDLGIIFEEN